MPPAIQWRFAVIQAERGYSREETAQKCQTSVSTISRWRKATMPQLDSETLTRICRGMECTPADLMMLVNGEEKS